jgi:hypothetical protein
MKISVKMGGTNTSLLGHVKVFFSQPTHFIILLRDCVYFHQNICSVSYAENLKLSAIHWITLYIIIFYHDILISHCTKHDFFILIFCQILVVFSIFNDIAIWTRFLSNKEVSVRYMERHFKFAYLIWLIQYSCGVKFLPVSGNWTT